MHLFNDCRAEALPDIKIWSAGPGRTDLGGAMTKLLENRYTNVPRQHISSIYITSRVSPTYSKHIAEML